MQKDMHYSAVYVMARYVGIEKESAHWIASASQFVDESRKNIFIKYSSGHFIEQVSTAHSVINYKNFSKVDQRNIWIPFHFLPGNIGTCSLERFLCRKDSEVARRLIDHFFKNELHSNYYLEYFGIILHIYMDTFSHYGFSGINTPYNHVHHKNIKIHNMVTIMDRYRMNFEHQLNKRQILGIKFSRVIRVLEQEIADHVAAIGHSSCAHIPDLPYVNWSFSRKVFGTRRKYQRVNENDFLEASEKTFCLLKKIRNFKPEIQSEEIVKEFSEIKDGVMEILRKPGRAMLRIKAWESFLQKAYPNEKLKHIIYPISQKLSLIIKEIERESSLRDIPFYRYNQAAHIIQVYILRNLLPEFDLYIL